MTQGSRELQEAYVASLPSFMGRNYKLRALEFQAAERELEISHLQQQILRERAKVQRHDNNLVSAQAIAKMLQVRQACHWVCHVTT